MRRRENSLEPGTKYAVSMCVQTSRLHLETPPPPFLLRNPICPSLASPSGPLTRPPTAWHRQTASWTRLPQPCPQLACACEVRAGPPAPVRRQPTGHLAMGGPQCVHACRLRIGGLPGCREQRGLDKKCGGKRGDELL
eukprot:365228-Chlamydomonas_euryale.AAC.34